MDGRRQSGTGGRGSGVVTPSGGVGGALTGGQVGAGGLTGSTEWVVGTRVRLTTIIDDTYEGTIFAYDSSTNTVSIAQQSTNTSTPSGPSNGTSTPPSTAQQPQDYRIIKISFLKEVTVLSRAGPTPTSTNLPGTPLGPFTSLYPPINPISLPLILDREKAAVKAESERYATRGVGVTKEAQDVFNALNRTMQCRWQGKTIVVVDAMVAVEEPYTSESCKALGAAQPGTGAAAQAAAQKTEMALGRIRKVLEGERRRLDEKKKDTPVPAGERKGGHT
ncbi:anticodon-binding domain-containing protein [Tirmania nivea]|nr:anticodon-binding domain-containing protein [Tirmania nivea]